MAATTKSYVIPLRKSFRQAAPFKRAPKAIRAIKAYVLKHAKVEEVKLGAKLNAYTWAKGITNPPHKVKVTALVDNGIAKVELDGFAYEETKKVVKKQEPQSLKEKIQEKIGAPKTEDKKEEAETKPEEKPVKEEKAPATKKETSEEKPVTKESKKE